MALSRKKKIIIGVTAVAVLGLIVIASIFASNKEQVEVTTQKIEPRQELRSTVTASGEVRPIQYINLTSEVQGRIEEIYVKEGDQVTKGQPLVRLDPTQLDSSKDAQYATLQAALSDVQSARIQESSAVNNVTQAQQALLTSEAGVASARQQVVVAQTQVAGAQTQVDRAQTEVDRAQVEVNTAQRELNRTKELVESGVASRQDYDTAKDLVDSSLATLRTAQASAQTAKASLNTAREQLAQAKIAVEEAKGRANQQRVSVRNAEISVKNARAGVSSSESRALSQQALLRGQTTQRDKTLQVAPLNGVVAEIPSKVGTFAVANLSSTALLTIADMSTVNIEVKVDETEIKSVAEGQEAKVKVDAFQDREIKGKVVQKTPLAIGKSQTGGGLSNNINVQEAKEFRVVIRLEELPKDIQDGLRPGMSATATITTKTRNDVITVPLQAIVEKQPEESEKPANAPPSGEKPKPVKGVYYLEGNKVKFANIETGITGESDIEILQGVQKDMEVITGPSKNLKSLKEGDTVKRKVFKPGENSNSK
jgi:HlyD family secretion protein